ncbi:MAG: NDP-sugar synthase [Myxococcales bacterium]|nr:NDP-sugar synthase [Myxococcales bacterium]
MKALILAAGLGSRMAPLSQRAAKVTLPVLGRPMIRLLIDQLADQGLERAVVNIHAIPESVRAALRGAPIPIRYSPEPVLLGSGGSLRAARSWLEGSEPFLVINGDMLLDLDLGALLEQHRAGGTLVTLGVRDDPRRAEFGSLGFDAGRRLCRITTLLDRGGESASGLFLGVQLVEPALLERLPEGPCDSVRDLYLPMLRDGLPIGVWEQPPEARWWPIGTPRELLDTNLLALAELDAETTIDPTAEVRGEIRGPVWVGARARIAAGTSVGPGAVICAGAEIGTGSAIEQSLVLPHAKPRAPARLRYAVAYEKEYWSDA